MIFVDGKPLKQVLSPLGLKEGTFYVDEEKEKVFIRVPEGTDIGKSKVEAAVRSGLFSIGGRKNVVLRGFVFTHDNTPVQGSAVGIGNSSNILIEDCQFILNNWSGFGFGGCEKVTSRRNVAKYNGGAGMTGWKLKNVLDEDNETSDNNWRGASGGFTGWAVAGMKNLEIHNAIYRNQRSVGNQTRAFWFDCDSENIVVENAFWCGNEGNGIFFENDRGPILLKNSILAFNKGAGINSTTSSKIILEDNIIYGNKDAQIQLAGGKDREDVNFETKAKTKNMMENWTLKGNVIAGENKNQLLIDTQPWEHFLSSLSLSRNLYYNPEKDNVFKIGSVSVNFADWQNLTGGDLDSMFANPDFKNPGKHNFATGDKSPLKRKDQWQKAELKTAPGEFRKRFFDLELKANWETPYPFVKDMDKKNFFVVDLSSCVNEPLKGDGAFVGAGNLDILPGLPSIHGVSFKIIDQAKNNGFAAILLKSEAAVLRGKNYPAKVEIPVGKKAKAVYFLHGSGWIAKVGKIGEYDIVYSDGTSEKIDIIVDEMSPQADTISNICNWWPTCGQIEKKDARKVIVMSSEGVRYIYTLQWINPKPEKTIEKIILKSIPETTGALSILGITAVAE